MEEQDICRPFSRAEFKAGRSMPARTAMMAITTRSSIRENREHFEKKRFCFCILLFLSILFCCFSGKNPAFSYYIILDFEDKVNILNRSIHIFFENGVQK